MGNKRKHRWARKHPQAKFTRRVQVTGQKLVFTNGVTTEEVPIEEADRLLDKYLVPEATGTRDRIKRVIAKGGPDGPTGIPTGDQPMPPAVLHKVQVKLFPEDFIPPYDQALDGSPADYEAMITGLHVQHNLAVFGPDFNEAIKDQPEIQHLVQNPRYAQVLESYWEARQYLLNHMVPIPVDPPFRRFTFMLIRDGHVVGHEAVESAPIAAPGIPLQPLHPQFSGLAIQDIQALDPAINARLQAEGYHPIGDITAFGEMAIPATVERSCAACGGAIDTSQGYTIKNLHWLCPACAQAQDVLQEQYRAASTAFEQRIQDAGQHAKWILLMATTLQNHDTAALEKFYQELGIAEDHKQLEEMERKIIA